MTLPSIRDVNLHDKRVGIRVDFNVPMEDGKIINDARLRAALPTIQLALAAKARVFLWSHLGRPDPKCPDRHLSLEPVAKQLSTLLNYPVRFESDWLDGLELTTEQVVLCENVRFNPGEKENNPELAKKMAALCDVFVMDAFATAHRSEASTVGVVTFAPISVMGLLVASELQALDKALQDPRKPVVAIVGGAKVSDKIQLLKQLIAKVDTLIVGGGIANTFLVALGYSVGQSLYEKDCVAIAETLLEQAQQQSTKLLLPKDVVVAKSLTETSSVRACSCDEVKNEESIYDVGPESSKEYAVEISRAGTIIWNGPLGVFEVDAFSTGTQALAKAIAKSQAFTLAGGGETLTAIERCGVRDNLSYVSTGGGAFLAYLEGKTLPAIGVLERSDV